MPHGVPWQSPTRINSSPQGDGNCDIPIPQREIMESTHPRKGTETKHTLIFTDYFMESTHPRKGTETSKHTWQHKQPFANQLIPARGRKLPCIVLNLFFVVQNQLIPARGRKRRCCHIRPLYSRNQLIPARGRKHAFAGSSSKVSDESTHPRKGTETSICQPLPQAPSWNQLIPARGRKLLL